MALVNPFPDDPERGAAFEQGYEAGFAEPEEDHAPPLIPELLEVFAQGELSGRDDRRAEPGSQDPVPAEESPEFARFESALDGTLIPIPSEFPPNIAIREDAQITVNQPTGGFYVVIFNGPAEQDDEMAKLVGEVTKEVAITRLEHMLAHAAARGATGLIRFGGFLVSVAISVFTPSPILNETYFRGYLPDGTSIRYAVLTPQN
jgi:hypothetical protein